MKHIKDAYSVLDHYYPQNIEHLRRNILNTQKNFVYNLKDLKIINTNLFVVERYNGKIGIQQIRMRFIL